MEGLERLNVEDLISENRALHEELTQCKADKDFVWNLWRRLQSSQPDLSSVVSMVVAREKEKNETKDQKVLEILQLKDEKIKELKGALDGLEEEATYSKTRYHDLLIENEEMKQKLDEQESELSRKKTEISEEKEYVSDLVRAHQVQKEAEEKKFKENLDVIEEEKNNLKDQIVGLENHVKRLSEEKSSFATVMETNAAMGDRIKALAEEMQGLTEKCSQLRKQNEDAVLDVRLKETRVQEQKEIMEQQSLDITLKESTITSLSKQLQQAHVANTKNSQQISKQEKLIQQLKAIKSEYEQSSMAREQEHSREVASLQKLVADHQAKLSWYQSVESQLRQEVSELTRSCEKHQEQLRVKEEVIRELKETVVGIHPGRDGDKMFVSSKNERGRKDEHEHEHEGKDNVEQVANVDERAASTRERLREHAGNSFVIRKIRQASDGLSVHPGPRDMSRKLNEFEGKVRELKKLLELKESELVEIRRAHSQRQQRYRMLKENYQFVLEQVRTYEGDPHIGSQKPVPERPNERELRHEDSDQIWKELAHYKTEYETLAKERHDILEEIDVLRVQQAGNVVTIQELHVHLQEERTRKEKLLREISEGREEFRGLELEVEKLENDLSSWQDKALRGQRMVEELEEERQVLEQGRVSVQEENKALRRELAKLADEFEQLKVKQQQQQQQQILQQQQQQQQQQTDTRSPGGLTHRRYGNEPGDNQTNHVKQQVDSINRFDEQVRRVADRIMGSPPAEIKQTSPPRKTTLGTQTVELQRTVDFSVNVDMSSLGEVSSTEDEDRLGGESGTKRSKQQAAAFKKPVAPQTPLSRKAQGLKRTPGRNEWASMKQRILSLTQEVSALRQAKDKAVKGLSQQKETNESLRAEFNVVLQKLQVSRHSVQHLTDSLKLSQKEKDLFLAQLAERNEDRVSAVSVADWKHLEEQLTLASRECMRLSHVVRSLTTDNDDLKAKLKEAQQKVSRMEHAVNQKKTLMDEMKSKMKEAQDKEANSSEQMKSFEERLTQMKEREKANKVRIGTLERRQQAEAEDKSKYHQELLQCQEELRKKTQLLGKTQALRSQAEVVVSEMEAVAAMQLQGLANQSEAAMTSLRRKLDKASERLDEFQAFVKTLMEDLLNSIRRGKERLNFHQKKQWNNASKPSVKAAQQKARDILDISSSDLEEILQGGDSFDTQQWTLREKTWWKRLEAALKRQVTFAVPLLELLLDAIEEKVSVESKLRTLSDSVKE